MDNEQKKAKIDSLLESFRISNGYDKIVTYYGNCNSKVVIIAESPVSAHYYSESNSIFCLDAKNFDQTGKSGEVIIRAFKDLKLEIQDYFFDNIFKVPIAILNSEDKKKHVDLIIQELRIMQPEHIIILGNSAWDYFPVTEFQEAAIYRVFHPAYIIRNNYTNYSEYLRKWEKVLSWNLKKIN